MKAKIFILLFFVLIILSVIAYSHGDNDEEIEDEKVDFGSYLKSTSINYILITSLIVIILVIASTFFKEKTEKMKWLFFLAIIIPIILTTIYTAGSTIYLNLISETKGPVHWHADYEIWNCDEKIELIKPKGISNRIGSAIFHDHGDNRIHVEGVVNNKENVDLHNFFEIVGGDLDKDRLVIPTGQKTVEVKNGDLCNGEQGKLQVFVYRIINPNDKKGWIFEQKKVEDFPEYILSPYSQIPPGDCIIIEFTKDKQETTHICETYKAAIRRGEVSGG